MRAAFGSGARITSETLPKSPSISPVLERDGELTPFFIRNPKHPVVATTLDLLRVLRSISPEHPDKAIATLAKAVHPEHSNGVWEEVVYEDDRFDSEDPWRGWTRAKFNGAVVTVHEMGFTDFNFRGPWFEVEVNQHDFGDVYDVPTFGTGAYCYSIQIVRGRDCRRYFDWARHTGTILKPFRDAA
jgi:hypothetical protein